MPTLYPIFNPNSAAHSLNTSMTTVTHLSDSLTPVHVAQIIFPFLVGSAMTA